MKTSAAVFWVAARLGFGGMLGLCAAPMVVAEAYFVHRAVTREEAPPNVVTPTPPSPAAVPAAPTPTPIPLTPPPEPVPASVAPVRTGARQIIAETYHAGHEDTYARWVEGRQARGW